MLSKRTLLAWFDNQAVAASQQFERRVEWLRTLPFIGMHLMCAGVIWVGVHKAAGSPALWTASNVSGQSFLRDRDPTRGVGILPVKRTPMLRIELAPPDLPRTPAPAPPSTAPAASASTP